jgi:mono/diheme cytochrome c family protein
VTFALAPVFAQTTHVPATSIFEQQIKPVLDKQCLVCHGAQSSQGGLDLTTRAGLLRGGASGPAILPGNAKGSLLYKLISHEQEPAMPYKAGKLPDELIAKFADWINAEAPYGQPPVKSPDGNILFGTYVRPVFEAQCLHCHGAGQVKRAGLDLSTRDGLLRGGDTGPAIVPGNARESALYRRVNHQIQPGMPFQSAKLSPEQIDRIGDWIDAGAPYDGVLSAKSARRISSHWAFQVPQKAPVPGVKNASWVRNPIDAFIAFDHEKHGLRPMPQADKRVLLRRVYLDLIGLPPTREEMKDFLADNSPDAYEKVVDTLLARPQYGERWGRHWMDIWRYSDVYGSADRSSRPHIWHWRDWIIQSLNQDKGYDRMLQEMLAGDEIAPTDPKTLAGTGFLGRSYYIYNRDLWLQDTVEHTAAAFLGLTLRCARCHDHKYDPVAQEEYYRFRAFFEPEDIRLDRLPGQPDLAKDGLPRAYDAEPRPAHLDPPKFKHVVVAIYPATYKYIRGNPDNPDQAHPLSPGVPEILGGDPIQIQPVELPLEAIYPDFKKYVQQDLLIQARQEIERSDVALARAKRVLANARERASDVSANPGTAPKESERGTEPISFDKAVKLILAKNCLSCHGLDKQASGLMLESAESILQGGVINGPVVLPRNSSASPLILYLRGDKKPRMPLNQAPLAEQEIAAVASWIDHLPVEDPAIALHKAEDAVVLAEKHLAWARANLSALDARMAAENAKYANPPNPRAPELAELAQKADRQASLFEARAELAQAQQKLSDALNIKVTIEKEERAREQRIDAAEEELEAALAALNQATTTYTPLGPLYPARSSGRRLALARWMTSRQNPLTARVAVNHIWLRHFGKALVPSVANFGMNGKPPTHPALLDWLACEFMESGWSMKALHRLIVTSSVYQMQSSSGGAKDHNDTIDPDNKYVWRMNAHRMEAEVVRDTMLYLAGSLESQIGGPEIDETKSDESHRRSLYFHQTPDNQMAFLQVFDGASPIECYVRSETVAPQQALALSNSRLSFQVAVRISGRLGGVSAAPANFVSVAFETVLGRPPSSQELSLSEKFLIREEERFRAFETTQRGNAANGQATLTALHARENLVHALLNHNDFVTIR